MAADLLENYNKRSIEYKQLTSNYLEPALALLKESFYADENVCKAVQLPQNPAAVEELQQLPLGTASDGVSVIAVDKQTNRVVGVAFNKIQVKKSSDELTDFEVFSQTCKEEECRAVVDYMSRIDNEFDLFKHCNADCGLEIMFLGTDRTYRNLGIARTLVAVSVELGRKLSQGINVRKHLEEGQSLPLGPLPKFATAIFTTFKSQRIGEKLGFQLASELNYDDISYKGQTYSEVIGPETKTSRLVYLRL